MNAAMNNMGLAPQAADSGAASQKSVGLGEIEPFSSDEQERMVQIVREAVAYSREQEEKKQSVLYEQIESLTRALQEEKEKNAVLARENEEFLDELDTQLQLNERFQADAREIMGHLGCLDRCDASCPAFDLCKKRILLVGGVTRIKGLYRQLIEKGGGVFEYHDGYMTKGAKDLERRFKQADMVLCPVTCNSHGACSVVKKLGKKYNTPVHMLASSSLTALSHVIRGEEGADMILN